MAESKPRNEEQDQNLIGWVTLTQAVNRLRKSPTYIKDRAVDGHIRTRVALNRRWYDGIDIERIAATLGLGPMGSLEQSYGKPEPEPAVEVEVPDGAIGRIADHFLQQLERKYQIKR